MSKMQDIQDWLRKYLFWCLCGSIALFSLAAWWFGVSTLTTKAKDNVTKIEGNFSQANQITQVVVTGGQHPNDKLNTELNKLTLETRKTVLKTWEKLFDRQNKAIFKWPTILDKNFQAWIKENPWNTEIPFDQLDEYQNKVLKELERIVTKVANAEWPDNLSGAPTKTGTAGTTFSGSPRGGSELSGGAAANATTVGVPGVSEKLLWDPADITLYKNRYKWALRPTTTEVRLAQEDLWILEQLCSVITQVNGQIPPYQRPIKVVKKIAIEGFALDGRVNGQPNGIGTNRILRTAPATTAAVPTEGGGETATAPAEGAAVEGAPAISSPPSRLGNAFRGSGGGGGEGGAAAAEGGEGGAPAEGAAARKEGDDLYDWRYVDQKGYPLSKAQLDGEHKNDLYRMVPFKMQMHILQASLPKLLETIKDAPLTMEVNEIRINADSNAANQFGSISKTTGGDGGLSTPSAASSTSSAGLLPGEVVLEIQGVVFIAQPYDEKKLPPPEGVTVGNET